MIWGAHPSRAPHIVFAKYLLHLLETKMAANPFTEISEKLDTLTLMVAEMQRQTKVSFKPVDAPLTIEEAADYLNLSKSRLYRLTSERGIPFIKRGRGILFSKADLDNWLLTKRQKTADEIRQEAKKYRER